MKKISIVCLLLPVFILCACGGGGGNSSAPTTSVILSSSSSVSISSAASSSDAASSAFSWSSVPALKDLAKFPIGMEVSAANQERSIFNYPSQLPTIEKHFNSLVAGVIMKMSFLHPNENEFFYTDADKLNAYAIDHNMLLHGHTLIWHWDSQIPPWMKKYTGDWSAMLNNHVTQICTHFAGKVSSWDVVNEALDESDPSGFRQSIFYQRIGKKYIENAFVAARKADPNAVLYYNEYNIESSDTKLNLLLTMLDDFKSRNIPVDGVGFQMHLDLFNPSIDQIKRSFKAVADRGYKIRISELDMPVNYNSTLVLSDAVAQQQKERYKSIVKAYLDSVPESQRTGITFWGLVDGESWYNFIGLPAKEWPLLFNDDYSPKPAFYGVAEALAGK
ncbi:beta-xylanase [Cellvibrio zantedeschiae]|uniref:Beta-xylanase n=1 Tax=Cellvibrio zantedeschiae TaxID=1237077 RepID=A0ABQ3AUJ5_9GAMM|nr:endo-1,4-beta-xylanase [Cellvibrio zantedeschiae]GGY64934.1 beta-xylanase [Cellvibrio zantedeschiae]